MMGYRGWKVWMSYDMHISLLALLYISTICEVDLLHFFALISSLGFYFMYGFLVNDFFDMPFDSATGKIRAVHYISRKAFIIIIIAVSIICALHFFYLRNPLFIVVYVSSYLLATFYSSPPIRFKERGFIGIVVCALVEKALPVLAIFSFFSIFSVETAIFLAASFTVHMSEIITHQIYDYESDMRTGTRTFAVVSIEKAFKTSKIIYFLSAALMFLLCVIFLKIPYTYFLMIMTSAVYVILHILISKGKLIREEKIYPLYLSCMHFLVFNVFPVFLSLILFLRDPSYIFVTLFALFTQYYTFKNIFNILRWKVISRGELTDT